jgi:hypothetical protein
MLALVADVRLADIDALAHCDPAGLRLDLDHLLGRVEHDLPELSDAIARSYLSHLQASRQLARRDITEPT